jgi:hypothetical protein
MLHEIEVLEARRIADLALAAREVRDRLLEHVPETDFQDLLPARGEHNVAADIELNGVLAEQPAVVALREGVTALPRETQRKLWVVAQIGHGDLAMLDWDQAMDGAAALRDADLITNLAADPDLHHHLHKGLYELGASTLPGDAT